MKTTLRSLFAILGVLLLSPSLAHAHVLQGDPTGLHHGFMHPFSGLDHILAMIAVGLWASQLGGRSTWMVPASFVGVMTIGGVLGASGVQVPFVETGIIVSILFLGLLVMAAIRMPVWAGMLIVGVFAIFHGHAHGAEMPATLSGFAYGAGFVMATALLHGIGLSAGFLAQRSASTSSLRGVSLLRVSGACIVVLGVMLAMGRF